MCLPKPPGIPQSVKNQQKAQAEVEQKRQAEIKRQQLDKTKNAMGDTGVRSLITSPTGSGYGRNLL